jgi:hypothetical protein
LLIGSGSVLMVFDLFNKQTFANQWWLAASLVVAGMAVSSPSIRASDATEGIEGIEHRVRGGSSVSSSRLKGPDNGQSIDRTDQRTGRTRPPARVS